MNRIEECEKLLTKWEAVRDDLANRDCPGLVKDVNNQIMGAKTALAIFKRPSNTQLKIGRASCRERV